MRRLFGFLLAGALIVLPAFSVHGTALAQSAPQKQTFTGDMVLLAYAVNADKTADYEKVIAQLKDALTKSEKPDAKQQLAGWKVMKNAMPQPDGSIVYIHVINPVVKDADYSITNVVYEAFTDPTERTNFYNMYRPTIKSAILSLQGPIAADLGK